MKKLKLIAFFLTFFLTINIFSFASTITTNGRAFTREANDKSIWTVIQSKEDGMLYRIQGPLEDEIKKLINEIGEKNILEVTGELHDKKRSINCNQKAIYNDKKRLERFETKCIKYGLLKITSINSHSTSDEEIPPPHRDFKAEKRASFDAMQRIKQRIELPVKIGQYEGIITKLNLTSPIKTIKLRPIDKNLRDATIFITSKTQIVKFMSGKEHIAVPPGSLKKGQHLLIDFRQEGIKRKATIINILK